MVERRVLYVIGAGRSGTTLLDIILGNQENHLSCGELNRLPQRGGIPPLVSPGSDRDRFWKDVMSGLASRPDFSLDEVVPLEREFCYHTGALRQLLRLESRLNAGKYDDYARQLYDRIFECSGKEVIIDSSKYPGRALRIEQALRGSGIRPLYIYIRRDPAAVVSSFAKQDIEQPSKSFWAANLYYAAVNFICLWSVVVLRSRGSPVVCISYEDLVSAPLDCISRIEHELAIPFPGVRDAVDRNSFLVGPLFDGNRIRLKSNLSLEQQRGKSTAPTVRDRISRLINWPFTRP